MYMVMEPTTAFPVHQPRELSVKPSEICSELPCRFGGGFFLVRNTAPGAQTPAGVFDSHTRLCRQTSVWLMEQKSSGKDGQHPGQALKIHQCVKGEPAQIGGVLLVGDSIVNRPGII